MHILLESGILSDRKEEEQQTGEIKRKFNGENIMAIIANIGTFDTNQLTYVDFLDCMIRVASLYPFPDQGPQKAQFAGMDQRLQYLIGQLMSEKYGGVVVTPFIEIMAKREQEMRYQPRVVLDDDAEDDYDDS